MSPVRTNSEINTPISPSSSGSHLSPVTPKSINELPVRTPDDPRQTNMTRQSNEAQSQQPISNLIASINNSLVLESSQRPSTTNHTEAFRESCSPTRPQTSDAQQSEQTAVQSTPNTSANLNSSCVSATTSNSNSQSNGVLTNSVVHSSSQSDTPVVVVSRSWVPETNRDNSINNSVRPTDGHGQRTRRSSRSAEEPSRRRSSRNSRQSTSNAQAVNLVRNGANYARPGLDLPSGYGKILLVI